MKTQEEVRKFVVEKLKEKNIALNAASLAIGCNGTYLFQFTTKAVPKRLPEAQRKRLANLLEVPEQELTDQDLSAISMIPASFAGIVNIAKDAVDRLLPTESTTAKIDIVEVIACCGNGKEALSEKSCGQISLPLEEFKSITNTAPENIKLIKASGDSMDPTIKDGDMVWIDMSNNFISSDGVYLLRMPTGLAIKRVQSGLSNITVKSDNPKYSDITAEIGEIKVIGKVIYIWNGRKV